MEGEGVKDYLRDIGRDVASSLGEELKGVAKDKATSFVKEQFGLGFQDELNVEYVVLATVQSIYLSSVA